MKNIFKNKKVLILSCVSVLVVAAIIVTIALIPKNTPPETTPEESTPQTTDTSNIDVPEVSDNPVTEETSSTTDGGEIEPDDSGLTPANVDTNPPETSKTTEKVDEPAKPVTETPVQPPKEPEQPGGITIGDGGKAEPYNCGVDGHHCANEYAHASLLNLELEGCPTCGSHSCPSFYALDEWGQTLYTPSKCPQYDIHKDPLHYCQTCGKKCGDGTNGTCCIFVVDTTCPLCHKAAKAWTCHYCD